MYLWPGILEGEFGRNDRLNIFRAIQCRSGGVAYWKTSKVSGWTHVLSMILQRSMYFRARVA